MPFKARPTVRCLVGDIAGSLDNQNQRSALSSGKLADLGSVNLDDIEHRLLAKATEQISGRTFEELHELIIQSVQDNTFYKVKVEQWRGAVWLDAEGRPWLCAAGLRRDGDPSDFYEWFGSEPSTDRFLPTEDDRRRLSLDRLLRADEARLHLLKAKVVGAVLAAAADLEIHSVALPVTIDPQNLQPVEGATLWVEVLPEEEADAGALVLSIKVTNYAVANFLDVLLEAKSALPGLAEEDWDLIPARVGVDVCAFAFVDTSWMTRFREKVESLGMDTFVTSPPDLTDGPDNAAHIVPQHGLTEALIEGRVIRALCGRSFVSSRDPNAHEMCPICAGLLIELERIVKESTSEAGE